MLFYGVSVFLFNNSFFVIAYLVNKFFTGVANIIETQRYKLEIYIDKLFECLDSEI